MKAAAGEARFYLAASMLKSALLERRYRPDQPRAPAGSAVGGQWIVDIGSVSRRIERLRVAEVDVESIANDLVSLGGGLPRLLPTARGARQFIFPNGVVLRFDLLPGQYLRGQVPHINIDLPGARESLHLNLR
jgi:hypothetical protein